MLARILEFFKRLFLYPLARVLDRWAHRVLAAEGGGWVQPVEIPGAPLDWVERVRRSAPDLLRRPENGGTPVRFAAPAADRSSAASFRRAEPRFQSRPAPAPVRMRTPNPARLSPARLAAPRVVPVSEVATPPAAARQAQPTQQAQQIRQTPPPPPPAPVSKKTPPNPRVNRRAPAAPAPAAQAARWQALPESSPRPEPSGRSAPAAPPAPSARPAREFIASWPDLPGTATAPEALPLYPPAPGPTDFGTDSDIAQAATPRPTEAAAENSVAFTAIDGNRASSNLPGGAPQRRVTLGQLDPRWPELPSEPSADSGESAVSTQAAQRASRLDQEQRGDAAWSA